jgi:carboxyl-terminal processing protease
LLEEEIESRYYLQAGRIRKAITTDHELDKAIEILTDTDLYSGILNGTVKADAGVPDGMK